MPISLLESANLSTKNALHTDSRRCRVLSISALRFKDIQGFRGRISARERSEIASAMLGFVRFRISAENPREAPVWHRAIDHAFLFAPTPGTAQAAFLWAS